MRASIDKTKPAAKKATIAKDKTIRRSASKRAKVPFDEMCRLMEVYGPTRCLRKRSNSPSDGGVIGAGGCTKIESVKRKFYRWFPDLMERFVKDCSGYYRPRFGHEFEMRYRQEMRREDGESLNRKRARRRSQQPVDEELLKAAVATSKQAFAPSILADATKSDAATTSVVLQTPSFSDSDGGSRVEDGQDFNQELLTASTIVTSAVSKQGFERNPPSFPSFSASVSTQRTPISPVSPSVSSSDFTSIPAVPPPFPRNASLAPYSIDQKATRVDETDAQFELRCNSVNRSVIVAPNIFDEVEESFSNSEKVPSSPNPGGNDFDSINDIMLNMMLNSSIQEMLDSDDAIMSSGLFGD